jgi:hypothetical protein
LTWPNPVLVECASRYVLLGVIPPVGRAPGLSRR